MSAIDVIVPNGDRHATADPMSHRKHGVMRALDLEVPIEDVAAALKRMESRQASGKIVVGL
jgi:alcohol dehydrogenase